MRQTDFDEELIPFAYGYADELMAGAVEQSALEWVRESYLGLNGLNVGAIGGKSVEGVVINRDW